MNSQSSHTRDKVLRSPLPPAKLADISHYLRSDIELIERDFEIVSIAVLRLKWASVLCRHFTTLLSTVSILAHAKTCFFYQTE